MTPLEKMLTRDEGLRLKPYRDTVGKLTIGIGRNLDDNGLRESEVIFMLKNDINQVIEELKSALPFFEKLSQVRKDILSNMCFNLGLTRLLKFKKTLAAIEKGDYKEASERMLHSKWASQVKSRAIRLSIMMQTNSYPPGIGE